MFTTNNKPQIVRVSAQEPSAPTITRKSSDQQITDAIASGFGALVSWGYPSSWKGNTPSEIEEAFKASGIDLEVAELSDSHATRQGCVSFRKWNDGSDTYRAEVSDKDKDTGVITISVQKQTKVGRKTDWIATESLTYKDGKFEAPANTPAGKRVVDLVNFRGSHYTGMEFSRWILKPLVMNANAVKLQDIDGLYYMIEKRMDLVAKIKLACDLLGLRFRKRNLLKSSDNVADMAENARDGLVDRIESIKSTLTEWEAKSKIRKSSEDALFNELDSIKEEAEVLADALGFALEDLVSSLASAKERAVEMINGKEEVVAPQPQQASVERWNGLLNETYLLAEDNGEKIYCIPLDDVIAAGVPKSTARSNYYYKDGNVHARALGALGFFGVIQDGDLIVQSI